MDNHYSLGKIQRAPARRDRSYKLASPTVTLIKYHIECLNVYYEYYRINRSKKTSASKTNEPLLLLHLWS
jgi:hypothetical protein